MNGTAILKTKRWGHCNPQASKMAALMTLRRWTSQSVGNDVAELGLQNPEFGLDEMVSSQASPKKTQQVESERTSSFLLALALPCPPLCLSRPPSSNASCCFWRRPTSPGCAGQDLRLDKRDHCKLKCTVGGGGR